MVLDKIFTKENIPESTSRSNESGTGKFFKPTEIMSASFNLRKRETYRHAARTQTDFKWRGFMLFVNAFELKTNLVF